MPDKLKIMIVEDEASIALLLKIKLSLMGFDIIPPVATGEDAIKSAKENNPDVLLTDITLVGKMDGIDATASILDFRKIPVIFITGYDTPDYRERAAKLNPLGYYLKPVTSDKFDEIKAKIEMYFSESKLY